MGKVHRYAEGRLVNTEQGGHIGRAFEDRPAGRSAFLQPYKRGTMLYIIHDEQTTRIQFHNTKGPGISQMHKKAL
jgi:hypothetical protein